MDEGIGGSAREESDDFEGDVLGVSVGADEDESVDSIDEASHSSVVDEGVGGSAREGSADFEDILGVSVGADEDESVDSIDEANCSSVVDEGVGGSAREESVDCEGDVVAEFQEENEEPWGELI